MNKFEYKNLTPFKWFVLENFPFIEADFDAITNYQLLCKVVEYLNKTIDKTNELGSQVEILVNWFNNLDVQDEVDKKLDEMTEDGTLAKIINQEIFGELTEKVNRNTEVINQIQYEQSDFINIDDYTENEDKTEAINEILNMGKRIFIPNNKTIVADNESFTKEKFEKFIKNGNYITNTIVAQPANRIRERKILENPNPIYRDMVHPSEVVNFLTWSHQKQSWLWARSNWQMNDHTAIPVWFQFSKTPSFEGQVPENFNVFIGDFEVLAYDISKQTWVRVYKGEMERCQYYSYYKGSERQESVSGDLPYTKVGNYRKYNIKYSDIEQNVVHGWLGTSEKYVQTNPNYKYVTARINIYTDCPYGYLNFNMGMDVYSSDPNVQRYEICGSRTSLLTNEAKDFYLSNVEPEYYDQYLSNDPFNIIEENIQQEIDDRVKSLENNRIIDNKFIGSDSISFNLSLHSNYLIMASNNGGSGVSALHFISLSTATNKDLSPFISNLNSGNLATVTTDASKTATITPKSGTYLTVTVIRL